MTVKETALEKWEELLADNASRSAMNRRCLTYANDWAVLMERQLCGRNPDPVKDAELIQTASDLADTDGISGSMFHIATNILVGVWVHGDVLREWHNRRYVSYPF